jgi:hypothetical protein
MGLLLWVTGTGSSLHVLQRSLLLLRQTLAHHAASFPTARQRASKCGGNGECG